MITFPINCNLCGTSLEINSTTNFAMCSKCGARLAIVRTPTAFFTELIDAESAGKLVDHFNELALQTELNRIELEWQKERENHIAHTQYGRAIPDRSAGPLTFCFLLIGGTVFIVGAATLNPPSIGGIMLGIFCIIFGIVVLVVLNARFVNYNRAESEYLRRKEAAIEKHRVESIQG